MGRLIDANANREKFKEIVYQTLNDCTITTKEKFNLIMTAFDNMPTAYDISKVVAELEKANEKIAKEDYCRTKYYIENDCEHKDCFKCCAEYLIDIVRKGGVE